MIGDQMIGAELNIIHTRLCHVCNGKGWVEVNNNEFIKISKKGAMNLKQTLSLIRVKLDKEEELWKNFYLELR